jgi:hypothetical protein
VRRFRSLFGRPSLLCALPGIAAAVLCLAATESRVSRATILAVEKSINERLNAYAADPFYVMGDARGTYLEGYGALFTAELNLVNSGPINLSPFKQTISREEIATTRERKVKKLIELKDSMRSLMMNSSGTLEGLPPNERIAMETILFYYSWEEFRGMPRRVFMSATRQKLLDAKAAHAGQAELSLIIEEQER